MCKKASDDSNIRKSTYYTMMVQNLMGNLEKTKMLYRLDVNFKIMDK